jgi:hypothetical protein
MPPLGPIVDLREDPETQWNMASQIGAAAGKFFGIRAAEKRKQRRDQMLVGVLQQAREENWTREQTYEEMLKIKGAEQSEFVKAYTQEMVKSQFREPEQFTLGGQGYTPEERWEYDQRAGQSKRIATGQTPVRPVKTETKKVFDEATKTYNLVRYSFDEKGNRIGEDILGPTEAPETTETTLAFKQQQLVNLQQTNEYRTLQMESQKLKNEAASDPDSLDNQLKSKRAEVLEAQLRKWELEADLATQKNPLEIRRLNKLLDQADKNIELTEERISQMQEGMTKYQATRSRLSVLTKQRETLLEELHDVLRPPTKKRQVEIRDKVQAIDDEMNNLTKTDRSGKQNAPSETGQVQIEMPDGRIWSVRRDQVEEAIRRGGKQL